MPSSAPALDIWSACTLTCTCAVSTSAVHIILVDECACRDVQ